MIFHDESAFGYGAGRLGFEYWGMPSAKGRIVR